MIQLGDTVKITWGIYKGLEAAITYIDGKNITVLLALGFEDQLSIDHVEKVEKENLVVVRVGNGTKTHVAKVLDSGFLSVGCGAKRLGGSLTRKVSDIVTSNSITCEKCLERFNLNK